MKKTVHYKDDGNAFIFEGYSALVTPIDHPDADHVSNRKLVRTSTVQKYDETSGIFETLNTIYVPVKIQ